MSLYEMNMVTSLSSNFDEFQWVKLIRQTIDEELEEETEIPVTIFAVPKSLMLTDKDSYIPQQVAIGPYHHLRHELYGMEKYKVAAARRSHKECQTLNLHHLVDKLIKFELRIRATYHRPLSFNGETLAWMMAVDASFLFEFLQVCAVKEGKMLTKIPSKVMSHLIDLAGNKSSHICILRDIMILENQIPLFVMRFLMEFQYSSLELADEMLLSMLIGVSKAVSPFKMVECSQRIEMKDCAHLLDFLYHFIVPKTEEIPSEIIEIDEEEGQGEENEDGDKNSFEKHGFLRQLLDEVWIILSKLEQGPVNWIKKIIFSRPLKLIVTLPWTILSKIPMVKMMKGPLEHMFSVFVRHKEKKDDDDGGEDESVSTLKSNMNNHPVLDEITIPSVTQLFQVGVQFLPTNEGINSIKFDEKTLTFHIPVINLDVNSEVVLRNLVAYEVCSVSGPLLLTRYTELMNGIIDADVDAKFLCQRGIIINHLKSEKEVANLWNGMSKSVRLTKVPSLDKVIGDVNKYYNGRLKVKFGKFMKDYVFGSWKILTFLAGITLLLLMCLQAFCQVYTCGRLFHIKALEPPVNN